jgi:outer membrane lipoprotein-sorting protein
MEFTSPSRQKLVSNGQTMWIYIPSMNVVAEQDLTSESGLFTSGSEAGLNRLFSKYHYRFASKEEPETMKDGSKQYTLVLKQKETRGGYKTINLWISENYFIQRAEGFTSSGKKIEITLSDIKTDVDLPNSLFKFDIPTGSTRIIKNPMLSEE